MTKAKDKRFSISSIIAVISAITAVASAIFAYHQTTILRKQLHVHVQPKISIDLNFYKRGYFQPVVTIRNLSPIKIVSLGADYQFLNFSKSKKRFVWQGSSLTTKQFFQNYPLYEKKLEPNDFVSAELGDVIAGEREKHTGNIFIFVIFVVYYRESDMEKFNRKEVFFWEDGKLFTYSDFISNPNYEDMLMTIQETEPPSKESFKNVPGDTLIKKFNEIRKVSESKDTDRVKESEKKVPQSQSHHGTSVYYILMSKIFFLDGNPRFQSVTLDCWVWLPILTCR